MAASSNDSLYAGELKFAKEKSFFETNPIVRWLIGLTFIFGLFLFLHFREIPYERLELGSKAPRYIVTQVNLDYFDEESTILKRNRVISGLEPIYSPNGELFKDIESSLFTEIKKQKALQGFDYQIKNKLQNILKNIRFVDPVTYQNLEESEEAQFLFIPLPLQREVKQVRITTKNWEDLFTEESKKDPLSPAAVVALSRFLSDIDIPVEVDEKLTEKVQREMQMQIPKQFARVRAGSRIIDKGEVVTPKHLLMLYAMQEALNAKVNLWNPLTMLGSLIQSSLLAIICYLYFEQFWPRVVRSNRKFFLLVTVVLFTISIVKFVEFFLTSSKSHLIDNVRYPIVVPIASIIISSLLHPGIAVFVTGILTMTLALALIFEHNGFILLNLISGLVSILFAHSLKRRKETFVVCAKAFIAVVLMIIGMHLYWSTDLNDFLWDVVSSAVFLIIVAVLVVGMLPLLESLFGIITDVTLMEYMDPNNEILRRLTIEAPGTYQHSVLVGNLAEAAASSIGANGLFCRVATLYHDIGKMATPQYFSENQEGSMNIHQLLTPEESAQVIISHVSEGVSMARKADLPEQFIDIIKEHHGTTYVDYFLGKQLDIMDNDNEKVDLSRFRYSGPKPRSRESVIIMLADSLEAAARSLDQMNEKTLTELMEKLVRKKIADRQFDRSILTLEELTIVKNVLVKTLLALSHSRVKYPEKIPGVTPDVEG